MVLNVVWDKRMLVVFYSVVVVMVLVVVVSQKRKREERGKKKVKLGEKQRERGSIIWREGG